MRSCTLILVLGLAALLLSTAAFATGNGDVTIKINGELPWRGVVMTGCDRNSLEIWITNDAPLYRLSIGLSFDDGGNSIEFVTPHGSLPESGAYVQVHGDAVGAFDLGGLTVNTSMLPDTLLLTGIASSNPLPTHNIPTLCYSLRLRVPAGPVFNDFYVDNVLVPPSGIWMFDDGSQYAPSFEGNPNSSVNNPDAPAARFPVNTIPCGPPRFTVTPNAVESNSHCSDYVFAFQAQDSKCSGARSALRFFSSVGTMDQATGAFKLTPDSGCNSVAVTASVFNIACMADQFTFTVNWIDVPVTLANCPTTTGHIKPNEVYEYPFAASDPDACDTVTFEAVPVLYSPLGGYQIDSTGKFRFAPTSADSGHAYSFDLTANGGCSLSDRCRFTVEVGASLCGDANGDEVADISDVVYLISYIFQGGLQPNPLLSGDVDCNAVVDISDAVYLVGYIFSGGPQPCQQCP